MTGMKPITRRALRAIVAGFVINAGLRHAAAQSEMSKNTQRRLSISAPDSSDDPTPDGPSWHNITQIVTEDLRASGRFVLIEPDSPIVEKIDAAPAFNKWRSIHTELAADRPRHAARPPPQGGISPVECDHGKASARTAVFPETRTMAQRSANYSGGDPQTVGR
jgi:hypothetical protein